MRTVTSGMVAIHQVMLNYQVLNELYAERIAADYSFQRLDKQSARSSYTAAKKIFGYMEVKQ